jgi:tRNA (guanine-N7-)-methyltransferase
MSWQNQYIELVTTKPGLIRAEQDRDVSKESSELLGERLQLFSECYVELGSGSGMHLLTLAQRAPKHLCIGFEIRFKRAFMTGAKAERRGLDNVLVFRTDAKQIQSLFKPASISGFFINYPDPWDKRRWLKNRLITTELLSIMWRQLKPGGFLRYKTDHQEYFESTCKLLDPQTWQVTKQTTDLLHSPWVEDNIPTEFEGLFKSQGKALCMLEAVKPISATPGFN